MAAQKGHTTVLELLLAPGIGAAHNKARATDGSTPLLIAAMKGHETVVKMLLALEVDAADPNMADARGRTPLFVASEQGNLAIAKLLLAGGADLMAPTPWGTAAEIAKNNEHAALVQLFEKGETICL